MRDFDLPQFGSDSSAIIGKLECSKNGRFNVLAVHGLSEGDGRSLGPLIARRRVLAVVSPTVDKLYGGHLKSMLRAAHAAYAYEVIAFSERRKQMATVERLCAVAGRMALDRRGLLVAIGGGVCSDVVTFAASMIRRGIDHIRIPTTLIGQVDAGIGIKGAVNLNHLKSFMGCFHPPVAVLVDGKFLATLPRRIIRQGLAEILKMALILDARLFAQLEHHGKQLLESRFQAPQPHADAIVGQAVRLMLGELQRNPFEDRGYERLVDMGHTFSPVLEARSGFRISHGDAVAIDMALSCAIGVELGLMDAQSARDFIQLLMHLGLPLSSPLLTPALCDSALRSATAHRGGQLNLVVPRAIGAGVFVGASEVTAAVLKAALDAVHALEISLRARRAQRMQPSAPHESPCNEAPVL